MGEEVIESYREVQFELDHLRLAGQEWGEPGGLPVLALHGWLDNAASFDVLAPMLKGVHLVALDSAGHGLSAHRCGAGPYHIWEDVSEIFAVADKLGWERFALLGHSRGAITSVLAAGTFPERISHLVMLDGLSPPTVPMEESPQQLANSILKMKRGKHRGFPVYPDVESAVRARQQSELPLSEAAARLLVRRGLKEVENGYTWRSDPRLKLPSGFRLSHEHVGAFMERITARRFLALAEDTIARLSEQHRELMARFPQMQVERLSGSHHFHMEPDTAAQLAPLLNRFFNDN